MKVNSIDAVRFEATKKPTRTISKDAQANAVGLLKKMNNETVYQEYANGTRYTENILASISMGDTKFVDYRYLYTPTKNTDKDIAFCNIQIGKNELDINAKTGEITGYKKTFFTTWNTLLKRAEDALNTMMHNFDNKEVVTKNFFPIAGFTKKWFRINSI